MTKLGHILENPATPATTPATAVSAPTKLGKFHALGARGERVTLPLLGEVWIELAGHETVNRIESEVLAEMKRLGLEYNIINALTYEAERAARTLASCVRDVDDPSHVQPFGTLEEWRRIDIDIINACNLAYGDVRLRLDPISADTLSAEDHAAIVDALEKKSPTALRSYGVVALANFLLSTASQRATSPTARSSDGPGSPTTET